MPSIYGMCSVLALCRQQTLGWSRPARLAAHRITLSVSVGAQLGQVLVTKMA